MNALAQVRDLLTAFDRIDLGDKMEDCCGVAAMPEPEKKTRIYYPSLYLNGKDGGRDFAGIPESGTATVEYRVKERSVREDDEGKRRHSLMLEVRSLEPSGKGKGEAQRKADEDDEDEDDDLEEALGRIMDSLLTHFEAPLGERSRDGAGRYVGNETGGADPQTMAQAYGPGKKAAVTAGVAAGAAAAGGAAMGLRYAKQNYGGPGVPATESLKAAGGDMLRTMRKAWSRRLAR